MSSDLVSARLSAPLECEETSVFSLARSVQLQVTEFAKIEANLYRDHHLTSREQIVQLRKEFLELRKRYVERRRLELRTEKQIHVRDPAVRDSIFAKLMAGDPVLHMLDQASAVCDDALATTGILSVVSD